MQNKPWILFFGRLDKEKWVNLLIDMVEKFWEEKWELPFDLYVFGDWDFREDILELSEKFEWVRFLGRKSLDEIKRYKENINFGILPSNFLETFWLTFLETISWWIPVIGFKKWGAGQFILDEHDILKADGKNDLEKIFNVVNKNIWIKKSSTKYKKWQKEIWEITQKYTKEIWMKDFEKLTKAKKVLIVSDFTTKIWGIENYIHNVKDLLNQNWIQTILYWVESNFAKKSWFKIFAMFSSLFNFWERFKIKKIIKEYNPDLVFYNSVLRYFGGNSIVKNKWKDTWIMYHDFGYFDVFPSNVENTWNLEKKLNFKDFVFWDFGKKWFAWKVKNILFSPAYIFKFLIVKRIQNQKDKIDLHLVPSKFMEKVVEKSYWIDGKRVKTLKHFGLE